ncbi:hypothetical protein BAUCODRAFT_38167 [Baudoinia panamericana UAMH 10762]|uniref:WKF domain-containing protein n=1 Tax=Baudoinia panamericana (strain UAMH 10762) TaxID=717646 RepID=M2MZP5_BAUPA|nr:uncharacterized protein BAUCODRAFT_38167 [Baudoinia panamericana UAMH 10762]EMC92139.1 hypothetical protein BAUCODRAFT_38167 [Baudoinia panamericana UAMH 10762]
MASTSTTQHVPAWKRLGLRLKYAKESAEPTPPERATLSSRDLASPPSVANNKRSNNGDFHSEPKRIRLAQKQQSHASDSGHRQDRSTPASKRDHFAPVEVASEAVGSVESAPDQATVIPEAAYANQFNVETDTGATVGERSRRKSVAFTPDTKAEDGHNDESSSARSTANEASTDEDVPNQASFPGPSAAPTRKQKKAKHPTAKLSSEESARTEDSKIQTPEPSQPEYVRYLEQYHNNKADWKFNKNKQKDLLKNLFNVHRLPTQFNKALLAYVAGLQGAAARERVLDDAEAVLKQILKRQGNAPNIDGMESRQDRRVAYEAALRRQIQISEDSGTMRNEHDQHNLHEIREEAERGRRAEAVLAEMLTSETSELSPSQVQRPSSEVTTSQPRAASVASAPATALGSNTNRRKRKARTEVSSDEESSSDSSESERD